jgi:hypothetical protein
VCELGRVQQGLNRLFFGGVDEPAGVDDYPGRRFSSGFPAPRGGEAARERIRVGLVLRAAESLDEEAGGRSGLSGS